LFRIVLFVFVMERLAMIRSPSSRREFPGAGAAAATAWAGAKLYAAEAAAQPGPNDTINLALIGCGARGGGRRLHPAAGRV